MSDVELQAVASLQQQLEVMPAIDPESCTLGLTLTSTICSEKIKKKIALCWSPSGEPPEALGKGAVLLYEGSWAHLLPHSRQTMARTRRRPCPGYQGFD